MTNNKSKQHKLLAVFYFLLVFCIILYLFFALFDKPVLSSVDTEMSIFNDNSFSEHGHKIIMEFPEFAIRKYK